MESVWVAPPFEGRARRIVADRRGRLHWISTIGSRVARGSPGISGGAEARKHRRMARDGPPPNRRRPSSARPAHSRALPNPRGAAPGDRAGVGDPVGRHVREARPARRDEAGDRSRAARPAVAEQLPGWVWVLPGPKGRLILLVAAVLVVSVVGTAFGLWGRWQATRTTKRVQVAMRRRVFEHAARLPLHRVYQLRSGGAASLLREDAGGVGELIFSLFYNPWRAVVQLAGGLASWPGLIGGSCSARSACCRWRSVRSVSGTSGSARFSATSASSGKRSTP